MIFYKKENELIEKTRNLKTQKSFDKRIDKFNFKIPEELIDELKRKYISLSKDYFEKMKDYDEIEVKEREKLINRAGFSISEKNQNSSYHWKNYLSEEDRKIYDELEKKGIENRERETKKFKNRLKIEELKKQIAILESQL